MVSVGDKVKDRITGFTGIVVCRSEWLNKCVRVQVQPQELHDGKPVESQAFDEEQVEILTHNAIVIEKEKTGGDPSFVPRRAEMKR